MPSRNHRHRELETGSDSIERQDLLDRNLSPESSSNSSDPGSPSLVANASRLVSKSWETLVNDFEIALISCGTRRQFPHRSPHRILFLPLTWRELLDRAPSGFDRCNSDPTMVLTFGDVRVDFLTVEVTRSGKPIFLTAQGFKLLKFFSRHPQQLISRDQLLNEVWGYKSYPSTRTVDNHICMLRKKLEMNPEHPIHFLTVRGMGYRFVP